MDEGIEVGEAGEDDGEDGVGEVLREADSDAALEGGTANGVEEFIVEGEHLAGVAEHDFAGFGEGGATAVFAEECGADVLLEALHLEADGGRSSVEALRGAVVAGEIGGEDKCAEGVEVEIGKVH